jgi:Zn-dependent protease
MAAEGNLLLFALWYVVFLLSLTCHEAAHAFAAWRGGDDTAFRAGQVSLNPLPHIRREPLGTVLVPILTYFQVGYVMGWASAPYDPAWGGRHPRRAALMAAAGPAANLGLAALGFAVLRLGLGAGWWSIPAADGLRVDHLVAAATLGGWQEGLARLLSILLVLNVALFLFNLIPFPPMDGASILAGFARPFRRLLEGVGASPFASLGGLLLAWAVFPAVYGPAIHWILARLYP